MQNRRIATQTHLFNLNHAMKPAAPTELVSRQLKMRRQCKKFLSTAAMNCAEKSILRNG